MKRNLPALFLIPGLLVVGCAHSDPEPAESSPAKAASKPTSASASAAASAPTDAPASAPALESKEVRYEAGDLKMHGYLVWDPTVEGKRPGVLVVHEWWGHNPYARRRAEDLARLGYVALAVDMYGQGKTADHPKDAGAFAGAVMADPDGAQARFEAAMKALNEFALTDATKTGAIGYCFGGGVVLHMARRGLDLDAVASFHGSLGTKEPVTEKGKIKAKILVAHGADDPFVKPEVLEAFKKEMDAAGADLTFESYEGAVHSFTNPDADKFGKKFNLPLKYNEEADEKSWEAMKKLFDAAFSS